MDGFLEIKKVFVRLSMLAPQKDEKSDIGVYKQAPIIWTSSLGKLEKWTFMRVPDLLKDCGAPILFVRSDMDLPCPVTG